VLKAKVHFIEDVEMDDADIPAKPAYVPIEDSLGIAPTCNLRTSPVVGSSLKGMAFVQLFKLATIKTAACRAAGNHPIIIVKYDLEKGVRDIDVGDGKQYEVRTTVPIDYDYPG